MGFNYINVYSNPLESLLFGDYIYIIFKPIASFSDKLFYLEQIIIIFLKFVYREKKDFYAKIGI